MIVPASYENVLNKKPLKIHKKVSKDVVFRYI